MKFKAALVQFNDVIANNVILPLAIGVLWQSAMSNLKNQAAWDLKEIFYKKVDIDTEAQKLAQCNLVIFSFYIWNSDYQFELIKRTKQINPDCYVVVGGPVIHKNFENFWETYQGQVDLAILGEGEVSCEKILSQWPDIDPTKIPGAWTPEYCAGDAPRIQNFQEYVSPYLTGFYDQIVEQERKLGHNIQAVLQTNRGCPYHCTFCEEGKDYKNKMFFHPTEKILDEITWCGQHYVEFLTLADDNWGIAHRDIDLMKHICKTKLKYGYPQILDVTFAKNAEDRVLEMAIIDKQHNTNLIRGITVAMQSNNQQTLNVIKRFNLTPAKQLDFLRKMKDLDVPIYAEMIWPLPYETYETFCQGIDKNIESGFDNWIGIYPLALQSSADLYHDYKNDYEWSTPVVNNENRAKSHVWFNNPRASRWVNFDTVVRGHVFYHWLAVLYFFGFARGPLDYLKQTYNIPISQSVNNFLDYLSTVDNEISFVHKNLTSYWQNWLAGSPGDTFNSFSDQDTNFWYPYTHVASHLQKNFTSFLENLKQFLSQYPEVDQMINTVEHGVVRYGRVYPYQLENQIVDINHDAPKFDNLFEFCRYYYWWTRKRGNSRTVLSCY
jgi:hypothetical protein